jgi:hypothetical protein
MPAGNSTRGRFRVLHPPRAVERWGRKETHPEFNADSGNGGDDFARVDTFRCIIFNASCKNSEAEHPAFRFRQFYDWRRPVNLRIIARESSAR